LLFLHMVSFKQGQIFTKTIDLGKCKFCSRSSGQGNFGRFLGCLSKFERFQEIWKQENAEVITALPISCGTQKSAKFILCHLFCPNNLWLVENILKSYGWLTTYLAVCLYSFNDFFFFKF
jgi:hypothetical protein